MQTLVFFQYFVFNNIPLTPHLLPNIFLYSHILLDKICQPYTQRNKSVILDRYQPLPQAALDRYGPCGGPLGDDEDEPQIAEGTLITESPAQSPSAACWGDPSYLISPRLPETSVV